MSPAETFDPHLFMIADNIHALPCGHPDISRKLDHINHEQTRQQGNNESAYCVTTQLYRVACLN
jgi:hypothetical protein